ncbi:MAG: tryptophan synthase subunit alpha [Nitriliruptoraceae bacterium]
MATTKLPSSSGPAVAAEAGDRARPGAGVAAIEAAFAQASSEGRAALITYLTAGYPDDATSEACFAAAVESGADIIEVGLPFSDPMMDGPIIQAANQAVLDRGATVESLLDLVEGMRALEVPKVAMTYVTIADTRGYARFARECAESGIAGVILPDLPVVEASAWRSEAIQHGLATVFMASSVSTDERLAAIAEASTGWIYAAGLLGVTGVKEVAYDESRILVERVRRFSELPVAVGMGVKDRRSAAEVASFSDGVIVGSAIVQAIGDGDPAKAPSRVGALVRELRTGVAG